MPSFEDLEVEECIEFSMTIKEDGMEEKEILFVACRTDKNTVKIKSDILDEDIMLEMKFKKRPMTEEDFK